MNSVFPLKSAIILLMLIISMNVFSEGSKELNTQASATQSTHLYLCNNFTSHFNGTGGIRSQFATYGCNNDERLCFATLAHEVVYMGFQGGTSPFNTTIVYRIREFYTNAVVRPEKYIPAPEDAGYITTLDQARNGPNDCLPATPPPAGYGSIRFVPPAPGLYYLEFSLFNTNNETYDQGQFEVNLFDITVADSTTTPSVAKPGRVYSKAWQFYEGSNFYGKNYILSDDGIVTSAEFNNMDGGAWVLLCNQTGCGNTNWITDRVSLENQQAIFPQYKIFLNSPSSEIFPIATTVGHLIDPEPWGERFCDGHILFHVTVDKPGNVEIALDFDPATYQQRLLSLAVVAGENTVFWDGLDGSPTPLIVPNNVGITFTVKYVNGLTNLPLYDVEGNSQGFKVTLEQPPGAPPSVYWDDGEVSGPPACPNGGCSPPAVFPPGCHTWTGQQGNLNTINTWW